MRVRNVSLILFVCILTVITFVASGTLTLASPIAQGSVIALPADLKPITPTNAAQLAEVAHSRISSQADLIGLALADPYAADSSWLLLTLLANSSGGAVSSSGKIVVGIGGTKVAVVDSVQDLLKQKVALTFQPDVKDIQSFAVSPDGTKVAVFSLGQITLWDIAANKAVGTLKPSVDAANFSDGVFSPDGTMLAARTFSFNAAAGQDYPVDIFNLSTGAVTALSGCGSQCGRGGVFSPDEKLFAAPLTNYGAGASIQLWSLPDGKAQSMLKLQSFQTTSGLAFSPDGRVLAVGNSDGIFLLDPASGQTLTTLRSDQSPQILALGFSPDGQFLVSYTDDKTLKFWGTNADGGALRIPPTPTPAPTSEQSPTPASTPTPVAATCTVTAAQTVNLRSGPGTTFARAGTLGTGQSVTANAQNTGSDGKTWYRLTSGGWVRSDVIHAGTDCANLPTATG